MQDNANTVPSKDRVTAIIVAAGRGSRVANDLAMEAGTSPGPVSDRLPKQYAPLAGKAILAHTISAFAANPGISGIVAVIHPDDRPLYDAAIGDVDNKGKLGEPVMGGATRQESVRLGLEALGHRDQRPAHVLIHDAARPFVGQDTIDRTVRMLRAGHPAALAAVRIADTLKREDADGAVLETLPREGLWAAQTPQGFAFDAILDAHRKAASQGRNDFTDDAAVAEWCGLPVMLVEGTAANSKITTGADLRDAERRMQAAQTDRTEDQPAWDALGDVRVGNGFDVHAFADGDAVILGGVTIPHGRRLSGHSDADVGLHTITDAIFGALGDGDIGSHFPPSDPQWKGAASHIFLRHAMDRVARRGGRVAHIDLTIICEEPKVGPHREAMRAAIADICGMEIARVAVKATTSEQLGFTGRREGIAAMATATVRLPFK